MVMGVMAIVIVMVMVMVVAIMMAMVMVMMVATVMAIMDGIETQISRGPHFFFLFNICSEYDCCRKH